MKVIWILKKRRDVGLAAHFVSNRISYWTKLNMLQIWKQALQREDKVKYMRLKHDRQVKSDCVRGWKSALIRDYDNEERVEQ